MLDLFAQATKSALSLLGESALLRGDVPCKVNIERGVQLTGLDTEFETARDTRMAVTVRDVATIDGDLDPRVGEFLNVIDADGNTLTLYKLDVKVEDTGVFRRFVLVKA